ncbi:hypothetical protein HAX54_027557, partial [Datura stramonium]|nr:hypothetical protein [Datura stramonium]
ATEGQDGEPPHVEAPANIDAAHQDDPYQVASIISYNEARTLLDRWVMTSPDELLVLPPDPLVPYVEDIASWHFS